jgi:hypothetical protein
MTGNAPLRGCQGVGTSPAADAAARREFGEEQVDRRLGFAAGPEPRAGPDSNQGPTPSARRRHVSLGLTAGSTHA